VTDFDTAHANQFHASLYCVCTERDSPTREEVIDFVYGVHYFWAFDFGRELLGLDDLAGRLDYLRALALSSG
jgi:hypothetical protein